MTSDEGVLDMQIFNRERPDQFRISTRSLIDRTDQPCADFVPLGDTDIANQKTTVKNRQVSKERKLFCEAAKLLLVDFIDQGFSGNRTRSAARNAGLNRLRRLSGSCEFREC